MICPLSLLVLRKLIDDAVSVVDAAAPGAAGGGDEGCPEARVFGEIWVGCEVWARRPAA